MSTHLVLAAAALVSLLDPGCFSFGGSSSSPSPTTAPSSSAPSGHLACTKPPLVQEVCTPPSAGSPCAGLPAVYQPGCIGGCTMQACPAEITCAQIPDLPCGSSCADLAGATFWSKLLDVGEGCAKLTGGKQPNLGQCTVMVMEQSCPALVGSGWTSKLPGLMK